MEVPLTPCCISGPCGTEFLFFHMSPKPIYMFDVEIIRPKTGVTWPFSRFRIVSFMPCV
jgi:hypothetical protein